MEQGKVDIVAGANYVSFFQAQAAGKQFKILVDGTACSPDSFQVLATAGSHITTPASLAGKRIAVNVLNNIQTLLTSTTLQAAGVNSATVHYVQVPFPKMAQALATGKVDAISAVEPFITSAELSIGAEPVMSTCTGPAANFPMSGYFSTQKWVELVKTDIGGVTWTRDGKYLYFDSGSGLDPAISRLRLADRKLERVTGLKDFRRVEFSYYPWSGLTPDGAPLLLRDVGTQEVYALDFDAP